MHRVTGPTADDLNLGGTYKLIWTEYVDGLSGAGIRLSDRNDELVWAFNKNLGFITARNAYECIVNFLNPDILSTPIYGTNPSQIKFHVLFG